MRRPASARWLALLAGLALAAAALPAARFALRLRESNPLLAGRLAAEAAGCLDCHRGTYGREIPNPGSRWGTVPRFAAGNAAMYATSRREIEEFVRHGAPRAWRDDAAAAARLAAQRLRMPAYEGRLSERSIAAIVAWTAAVEGVELPGGEAAGRGRALAREHGCTACHGVEGAGGWPNPGSLGGFVPGFLGANFTDLVRDRDEFAEWIRTGSSARLEANPVVRFFWRRQAIPMPAYGETLSEQQIDDLWSWVEAGRVSWAAP